MATTGTCKHGEFVLTEGCPQCIEESRRAAGIRPEQLEMEEGLNSEGLTLVGSDPVLIKVQYYSESTGEISTREYTYYSEDRLAVGDIVDVPVRDTTGKAKVSAVDVPEAEIASFKDKVKTIPAGSVKDKAIPYVMPEEIRGVKISPNAARLVDDIADKLQEPEPVESEEPTTAIVKVTPDKDQAVLALLGQVTRMVEYANKRTVTSGEDVKDATSDLALVGKLKKAIEVERQRYTKPLRTELEEISTFFKTLTDPIGEADIITRRKVLDYNAEIERQRREAQRIEDEKLRLAREETELKGEHTVDLTPVEAPEATPDRVRTEVGSASKMVTWTYEIVDFSLLPDAYKIADKPQLSAIARSHHDQKQIPGIRFYGEPGLQVRSR